MEEVKIDPEGLTPTYEPDNTFGPDTEIDYIKEFGKAGIRGIGERWESYIKRMEILKNPKRHTRLFAARLKALGRDTSDQ